MSKTRPTAEQKRKTFERAKRCCEYCLAPENFSNAPLEVEHILPESKGGKTALNNLALACGGCNKNKSDKTKALDPKTKKLVSLFHPRRQLWSKHFEWQNDFTIIVGLTPTGRATVEALKMNRRELVNLRWALRQVGKHPPK